MCVFVLWQGKDMLMVLENDTMNLIDPLGQNLLHAQPIGSIRVWGVGRDNGRSVSQLKYRWMHNCLYYYFTDLAQIKKDTSELLQIHYLWLTLLLLLSYLSSFWIVGTWFVQSEVLHALLSLVTQKSGIVEILYPDKYHVQTRVFALSMYATALCWACYNVTAKLNMSVSCLHLF